MKTPIPCQAISELDLRYIIDHLCSEPDPFTNNYGWPRDFVEILAEHYRIFLFLTLIYPDELIIPYRELDEFWHIHILYTKKYMKDCQMIFGEYLHHTPYKQSNGDISMLYEDLYCRTLELIELHFPESTALKKVP